MKRDIAVLASGTFDLLVIGGGVVGACIVRDAARRGLKTALIEQADFAAAASEAMSHTIHGGIRYLATGQFGLVRSGLEERAKWARNARGFVTEQTWLLPLTGGMRGVQNRAGVALYQWMAGLKAQSLSKAEALKQEPALAMDGLTGAAVYQDFHLADPHRLVIAILQDAAGHGAVIANHVAVDGLVLRGGVVEGVTAVERVTGDILTIRATQIINATGPWAQMVADALAPGQKAVRVTGSKGIHLLTPELTSKYAIAVSGKGEHVFALPWHGMTLIGTTDEEFAGDLSTVAASEAEIEAFTAKVRRLMPAAKDCLDRTIASFAGVRALPGRGGDTYRAVREELIVSHADYGASGLLTVTGGKWTTARRMAERAVDLVAASSGKSFAPCQTNEAAILAPVALSELADILERSGQDEMAMTAEDYLRRLGRQALLLDPEVERRVISWLASKGIAANNGAGRDGRLP